MKLIFVYNAGSGFFNVAADMAHKIFSPSTYPCSLCDLTYGVFSIRPEWEDFVKNAPVPFEFLHKDEFIRAYPGWQKAALPLVLSARGEQLETFMSADDLNSLQSVAGLKERVLERLGGG